jgi:hypothetical protein
MRRYRQEGEQPFEKKRRTGLVGRPSKKENQEANIARLEIERSNSNGKAINIDMGMAAISQNPARKGRWASVISCVVSISIS